MRKFVLVMVVGIGLLTVLLLPKKALALTYDLIPPTGTLTRGQNVQFIIDVDTEGSSVTTATVGMTFNTQYLSYVSANQGDTLPEKFSAQVTSAGTLLISGENSAGYSGS